MIDLIRSCQRFIKAVDEHRDRPIRRPQDQHLFKYVARWIGQIDPHDIGPEFGDLSGPSGLLGDDADGVIAQDTQPV